jgi:hypothetical protein
MRAGTIIRRTINVAMAEPLVLDLVINKRIRPEEPDAQTWVTVLLGDKCIAGQMCKASAIFELADCMCVEIIKPPRDGGFGERE